MIYFPSTGCEIGLQPSYESAVNLLSSISFSFLVRFFFLPDDNESLIMLVRISVIVWPDTTFGEYEVQSLNLSIFQRLRAKHLICGATAENVRCNIFMILFIQIKSLVGTPEFVAPEVVNYDFISTGTGNVERILKHNIFFVSNL